MPTAPAHSFSHVYKFVIYLITYHLCIKHLCITYYLPIILTESVELSPYQKNSANVGER